MRVLCSVLNPKCGPITQGWILERHVGLHPNNCVTRLVLAVQHHVPQRCVVLHRLGSTRTVGLGDTMFFEVLSGTATNVAVTLFEHG